MEMHDRLRLAREARGYGTAKDAAEAMGVPYGSYAGHENGSRGIKRDRIVKYAKFLSVSLPWLEHGMGEGVDAPVAPSLPTAALPPSVASQDCVKVEHAVAVIEGALLARGLKPEWLPELREQLRGCLEESLVLQNPASEIDSRRNIAKTVVSQFLRQRDVPEKS